MRLVSGLVVVLLSALTATADEARDFDYYVLSLSWSPNWCDRTGHARRSEQCEPERDLGWVLHGLWPQFEKGWPDWCETVFGDPSLKQLEAVRDVFGTTSLAAYQWKKHGRCSGLSAGDYFEASMHAFYSVKHPSELSELGETISIPAKTVEAAFLTANPQLKESGVTVTCRSDQIQEIRVCLNKNLTPRPCGNDVRRDCTLQDAVMHPVP